MALINDTILMANKALNRVESLARQAKSYYGNPTMVRARQVAGSLANTAWVKGRAYATSTPVMLGAAGGAVAGVGLNMYNDPRGGLRSRVGAGLRGGLLGAAAGAGYKGYKDIGGMSGLRGIAGNARTRLGAYGARMRSAFDARVARAQASEAVGRSMASGISGGYSS